MRVQEKVTTPCAKMTEERSMNGGPDGPIGNKRVFGIGNADGSQSPNLTANADSERSCPIAGGRLKFFKDGKFILELSHRKEGDRTSWVPVPKKTYWPPPAAAGTPRQESSTSLSVSDDNSSVQSSPWQRDHCWKQSTPQRGISHEMTFCMRPLTPAIHIRNIQFYSHILHKKRRCPFDSLEVSLPDSNEANDMKLVSVKRIGSNSAKLTVIVQTLWDKLRVGESGAIPGPVRTMVGAISRMDPSIISPRKRILREMERVSLEDQANSKRQRARGVPPVNNNGGNCTVTCQTLQLGGAAPSPPQPKGSVSNYSITSLLKEEPAPTQEGEPSFLRTLLKSPSPPSSPRPRPKPVKHQQLCSPTLSPSPDPLRSSLRTPVLPSPVMGAHPPPLGSFLAPPLLYPPSPYLPHNPGPSLYYSTLPPVSYRGSPSLWVHYPMSSLPRGALYPGLLPSCPWPPLTHQALDDIKREDGSSDVPLNLSKHAG